MRIRPWTKDVITWAPDDDAGAGVDDAPAKEPAGVPDGAPDRAPPLDRTTEGDGDGGDGDDLLGGGSDDERKVVVKADWPEDWRAKVAGDDEKLSERLKRFQTPADIVKAWRAAEQKISSGEYKKSIDDAETDEEKAELRKAAGVPETPDAYELPEFETVELTADDPTLKEYLAGMHESGASNAQVQASLKMYDKMVSQAREEQVEGDKSYRISNEDSLRAEWGEEYRPRINLFKRVLEDTDGPVGPEVAQALMSARDASGNRVINSAKVAQWLVRIGEEHYGAGALVTGEQAQATASREAEIKQIMNTDFERYLREGLDKEYAAILAKKR